MVDTAGLVEACVPILMFLKILLIFWRHIVHTRVFKGALLGEIYF